MNATTSIHATWQRFSASREVCPGCAAVGLDDPHDLCRVRRGDSGRIVQCRRLTADATPTGWRCLGDAPLGTTCFAIPDDIAADRAVRRPARESGTGSDRRSVAPDELLDLVYHRVRTLCSEHASTNEEVAREFFEARHAVWNAEHYSVMPTRSEERAILSRLDPVTAAEFSVPGITRHRGGRLAFARARRDPEAAYIEWTLGPAGEVRGFAVRFLTADANPKTKSYSRHRLHHTTDWRGHRTLVLSEGKRKTNEAARICDNGGLGLPGVSVGRSVLHEALAAVRLARPRIVMMAADFADLVDGEQRHDCVRQAVAQKWRWLADRIMALGIDVRWAHWDPVLGKGIDDLLAAGGIVESDDTFAEFATRWSWYTPAQRAPTEDAAPGASCPTASNLNGALPVAERTFDDWTL